MKVLLLGGTGAMGVPLCQLLVERGHDVIVTSRSKHENAKVTFITGNALELDFVHKLMEGYYDVVVDFMVRSETETKTAMNIILPSCGQYIFLSSCRVFAPINIADGECITEDSPRLLEECKDSQYVESDEYAIVKAKEENLFFQSQYKNWTIVRPTLTYNTHRLQFAYGEKEDWLFRLLNGQSLVFPKDMVNVRTTMVYGDDVAKAIFMLIGNKNALGTSVNIVSEEYMTWGEILNIYKTVFERKTNEKMRIVYIENSLDLAKLFGNYYQVKYARAIDRCFSNKKLQTLIGPVTFTPMKEGLTKCVSNFLDNIYFRSIDWRKQAYIDRICNEKTPFKIMPTKKIALVYLCYRYDAGWVLKMLYGLKKY